MAATESGGWMGRTGGFDRSGLARHSRWHGKSHWTEVTVVDAISRNTWMRWLLAVTLLLAVLTRWIEAPGVPVKVLHGEIAPSVVSPGDPVYIKFIVDRSQSCQNSIVSYWTTDDNRRLPVARLPARTRVIPELGKSLPVHLTLTAPNWIGNICYQSRVFHRCSGGRYTVDTPPLCLTVTP